LIKIDVENYNMIECNKCGMCCRVIPISFTFEEIREMYFGISKKVPENRRDVEFIYKYWRPLSYLDIWRLRPDYNFHINNVKYYISKSGLIYDKCAFAENRE